MTDPDRCNEYEHYLFQLTADTTNTFLTQTEEQKTALIPITLFSAQLIQGKES